MFDSSHSTAINTFVPSVLPTEWLFKCLNHCYHYSGLFTDQNPPPPLLSLKPMDLFSEGLNITTEFHFPHVVFFCLITAFLTQWTACSAESSRPCVLPASVVHVCQVVLHCTSFHRHISGSGSASKSWTLVEERASQAKRLLPFCW